MDPDPDPGGPKTCGSGFGTLVLPGVPYCLTRASSSWLAVSLLARSMITFSVSRCLAKKSKNMRKRKKQNLTASKVTFHNSLFERYYRRFFLRVKNVQNSLNIKS
jgi:hypothetical protein